MSDSGMARCGWVTSRWRWLGTRAGQRGDQAAAGGGRIKTVLNGPGESSMS